MATITNEEVADSIRAVAAVKRVRQAELAASLNLSPMAMSRRFNGETPYAPGELSIVANHLGVEVGTFFTKHLPSSEQVAS